MSRGSLALGCLLSGSLSRSQGPFESQRLQRVVKELDYKLVSQFAGWT